jgi:hypothetical protein
MVDAVWGLVATSGVGNFAFGSWPRVPFAVIRDALPPVAKVGVHPEAPDPDPAHAASEAKTPAATTTLVNLRTNTHSLDL